MRYNYLFVFTMAVAAFSFMTVFAVPASAESAECGVSGNAYENAEQPKAACGAEAAKSCTTAEVKSKASACDSGPAKSAAEGSCTKSQCTRDKAAAVSSCDQGGGTAVSSNTEDSVSEFTWPFRSA